jgi:hypothetical protein
MDLIELEIDQLFVGMSLKYALRDRNGQMLLNKGQKIENSTQLEGIQSRKRVFVEIDQTEEGVRAIVASLGQLDRAGAPLKDFSKFLVTGKMGGNDDDKLVGTLVQQWGDVESRLGGLLASVATTPDFAQRIEGVQRNIVRLLQQDLHGSLLLLFNRSVTHFGGYSTLHSLLCAVLACELGPVFGLNEGQQRSLVCAALTMNVAMTQVQDQLALQANAPSPNQRAIIDAHAANGKKMLQEAGVQDADWLGVVAYHHSPLKGAAELKDWPPGPRMARILQTLDRYTAAMSPRKSRPGRTAKDSVRSVVLREGDTKHDEVGTAIVRLLGLSPAGTYVKLANGETAVVMRRGVKPAEPIVASVLNKNDEPIAEPRLRDTAFPGTAIANTLPATSVRVNLNIEALLRLMPRQA